MNEIEAAEPWTGHDDNDDDDGRLQPQSDWKPKMETKQTDSYINNEQ